MNIPQQLLAIPKDKGWRSWEDGDPADTTSHYGTLLAVNLTDGTPR